MDSGTGHHQSRVWCMVGSWLVEVPSVWKGREPTRATLMKDGTMGPTCLLSTLSSLPLPGCDHGHGPASADSPPNHLFLPALPSASPGGPGLPPGESQHSPAWETCAMTRTPWRLTASWTCTPLLRQDQGHTHTPPELGSNWTSEGPVHGMKSGRRNTTWPGCGDPDLLPCGQTPSQDRRVCMCLRVDRTSSFLTTRTSLPTCEVSQMCYPRT